MSEVNAVVKDIYDFIEEIPLERGVKMTNSLNDLIDDFNDANKNIYRITNEMKGLREMTEAKLIQAIKLIDCILIDIETLYTDYIYPQIKDAYQIRQFIPSQHELVEKRQVFMQRLGEIRLQEIKEKQP